MPATVADTGVIRDAVDASRAVLTFIIDALVDIEGAVILGVAGWTFAYVTVSFIEAIAIVFAVHIEAQLAADTVEVCRIVVALQRQIFQRCEVRVLVHFFICKVMQQYAADAHLAETAFEWLS